MKTSPAVPFTVEDNGRSVTVRDPIHAEKLAGLVTRGESGYRVYHPRPGVSWAAINRVLDNLDS